LYATSNAALLHKYQNDSVMTASPMDLVIMLYDGLIKQIKLGEIFLDEKDYEKVNKHLMKAQDIVSELMSSLDLKYPISENLLQLYEFMLQELIDINMHKDKTRIAPLLGIIVELKEAWMVVRNSGAHAYAIEE